MGSRDDIIPISSRRPVARMTVVRKVEGPPPPDPVGKPHRSRALAMIVAGAAFAMTAGLAIGHWRGVERIRALPDHVRVAAYARALKDIEQSCAPLEEDSGPLRQHCLQQAQFVVLFPECGVDCRRLVQPILPHAHR